jgi:rod shape-determining protein MreD
MHLTIAAAFADVVALAEFTVAPYLKVGDAVPHLVLVFGVIAAKVGGFEVGLACAFVGGLALDIIGQRPLGSSAFSLLVAIAVGSLVAGALGRVRIAAPIVATFVASVVYSVLLLVSTTALTTAAIGPAAVGAILPSAIYDTILAAAFGPLVVAIAARRREVERADW